ALFHWLSSTVRYTRPRVSRTTASSRPHAAQRSSENQYGRIMAHARGSVRRRLTRGGGGSGGRLSAGGIRLKPPVARFIVRSHDVILQDSAPTAEVARSRRADFGGDVRDTYRCCGSSDGGRRCVRVAFPTWAPSSWSLAVPLRR